MYLSNGKPMEYKEEGAAFLPPTRGAGMVPPRVMGLQPGMLTHGFVPANGLGDPVAADDDTRPYMALLAGAIAGFLVWRFK
jgi:hypothetical protein